MKKLLATCLSCLFVYFGNAQFEKGDKFIGGNLYVGLQSQSITQSSLNDKFSYKGFSINFNPQFLKAKSTNTLTGLYAGIGFSTSKIDQTINYATTTLGGGIGYLIRNYKPLSEKIFWYVQYDAALYYTYQWQTFSNSGSNQNGWGSQIGLEAFPALAFKADERLLVDVNFGGLTTSYQYSRNENSKSNAYLIQFNFTSRISLGLLWKLKRPKS